MLDQFSGATRVHFIVGDPIAQVKSPYGVTQAFEALGRDAICVPAQVRSADLTQWHQGVSQSHNVDGIIVTVPHKLAYPALCATLSPRAAFLQAVNTLRRHPDGSWHGDMFDGLGYVEALRDKGCLLEGRRALLVGAGGAGSAIAHSLVVAGVGELALHDENTARRDSLIERLNSLNLGKVVIGNSDPSGFDLAINATPIGMQANDPLPIQTERLRASTFVGCVITAPAVPPLIAQARALGCATLTGADMFAKVRDLMVQFLLET